jgi:glycosyltransferase involved in cell wall biosynthesis
MHILHIISGQRLYAQAQQAIQLIEGLARHNIKNTLICQTDSVISIAAQAKGLKVILVPAEKQSVFAMAFELRQLIRKIEPNLIHVHCNRGAGFHVGIAVFLAGSKAVISSDWPCRMKVLPRLLNNNLYERFLVRTNSIAQVLVDCGLPKDKIRLVRTGVDPTACQPNWSVEKFHREFGVESNNFVIGMIENFDSHQGHRHLLRAMPRIIAAYSGARVILLGKGPLEKQIRKSVEAKGMSAVIKFAGLRQDLSSFLGCFDLLVHLSTNEDMAMHLLEAQAAGVPVVAFETDGVKEIVAADGAGNLVPVKDYFQLALAIQRLMYRPKQRKEFGKYLRNWVQGEFIVSGMVKSYMQVYEDILSDHPSKQVECRSSTTQ